MHEISPRDLLLAATEAIALSLNINTIAGVSSEEQLSHVDPAQADEMFFDYNKFWLSLHAEKMESNVFLLPIPIPEKPIASIKQNHRARTLVKRKFKAQLRQEVQTTFQKYFLERRELHRTNSARQGNAAGTIFRRP